MRPRSDPLVRRRAKWDWVTAAAFSVFFVAAFSSRSVCAAAQENRSLFYNSVAPLPSAAIPTIRSLRTENLGETMEFEVPLRMRDFPKFLDRVGRGERIPRAELERDFLPLEKDYQKVRAWLISEGFTITGTSDNRINIFARGTVAQIQQCLQVEMVKATVRGIEYNTARSHPSLPASVAAPVLGINGLQPFLRAHNHLIHLNPDIGNKPPYQVKEILGAYDAANLGLTGSGQTIAILIDAVPKATDLKSFWNANGISASTNNLQEVNVTGSEPTDTEGEATLDVEWASGVAPGAIIRLYATGTLAFTNIDKGLERIISDLQNQVQIGTLSISLGLGENFLAGSSEVQTESQYFATITNSGVSVFVASGDAGSNPDENGNYDPAGRNTLQVEYEASDPSVTGVGGTNLTLTSNGAVSSETGWSGSGGGISESFSRPTWQTGLGVPSGSKRLVPDVSLVASNTTYAYFYFEGAASGVAGTSWATPTWAGFSALINEARANNALPPLGAFNPHIYPLISTNNFRDITSGSNGQYSCGVGYDMVTGIGVPDVGVLLGTLAGTGGAAPSLGTFSPTLGPPGALVTISGSNLSRATSVQFNGLATTSFTVVAANEITATVPSGASSG
ncbi:MAG TPA: protease pro-enzyme activation domain-containing protein, partial [Chthoniobacteraceae bacterium]